MGAELYERLKHLKRTTGASPRAGREDGLGAGGAGERPGRAPRAGAADPMQLEPPAGWERISAGVWRRVVHRPSDDAAYLYGLLAGEPRARALALAGAPGTSAAPDAFGVCALVPPGFGPDRLVFFDAETTGLSSGAGTSVFLVGFARIGSEGITTEQLFMADYPAEAEFLRGVAEHIGVDDLAISYNGKGFDAHVLGTRFLLNGVRFPIGAQLDLLYTTRRLWRKSLGQCSLGMVEEGVLGIRRDRDLPSAEVPERYFGFLRSGDPTGLEDAFAHHLQDVESLVALLARMERVFADPAGETPTAAVDRFQLGRMLLQLDRPEAEHILWRVVREEASAQDAMRAAHLLARYYRGNGRTEAIGELWRELMARHASVAAGIELAKYLEHRERAFVEAENLIKELLSWPHGGLYRGDLEKRLERVRRRRVRQFGIDASPADRSTASR
ncbi:MAG: hypothetical protein GVY14_02545 [Spirochaetes bacterium]|nr:hypothetical protein [Spirochaetota bacterium]